MSNQIPDPTTISKGEQIESGFAEELQQLFQKYGLKKDTDVLEVSTGQLTLEQINLVFQHLPVDISYMDEEEIVRFYAETPQRVFPRSKNIIGKHVLKTHPGKSHSMVQEIIEKFRSGEKDKAEFWINKPNLFIYIAFTAVRDAEGRFRGVLEMMQDCTYIRNLEGSQTALEWNESMGAEDDEAETQPVSAIHNEIERSVVEME